MVFDEDQTRQGAGGPPTEDARKREQRGGISRAATAAAAAGAAGAGLGAGAAAGIIGGDDAVAFIRGRVDETAADSADVEAVQARIEAAQATAQEAARSTSFDVFDDALPAADAEAATDIANAAGLIGSSLPPLPAVEDAEQTQADPETPATPPLDGNQPPQPQPEESEPADDGIPTGPPTIGRPRPQSTEDEIESEAPEGPEGSEGPEAPEAPEAAPAPGAPAAPEAGSPAPPPAAPGAPAPPAFPSPPSPGTPPAPAPGGGTEDEVVAEQPAPPASPGPAPSPGTTEEVVAEAPAPPSSAAPPNTGAPVVPESPVEDDEDIPVSSQPSEPDDSSGAEDAVAAEPSPPPAADPGSSTPSDDDSSQPAPPVSSDSGAPDASEPPAPPPPASPEGSSDSSESSSSEESSSDSSSSEDSGPPPAPVGSDSSSDSDSSSSSDSGSSSSASYPYVNAWDDDGDWVEVAMENAYGEPYFVRYYDDGGVYYQNEHGQWEAVEGDDLPHLLYVDEYGTAYFSKVQYQHNVYFSLDADGDLDWVDYEDIPGYAPPEYDDDYDYPRVVDYYAGDEGWALVQLEDGRMVKYYDEGGAYWVDEYGNETAISGFQVPTLLYVDGDGDAYFRVFNETEGYYQYYTIDHDGGVEYIHDYDVPGYEEPRLEEQYEYPRVVEWDDGYDWVIIENENGDYAKIYTDGTGHLVDESGEPIPGGEAYYYPQLLHVDQYGNAYFREGDEGDYDYYMIDHDGGVEYVEYGDIPGYDDVVADGYPRLVEYHDGDPDWALVEQADGSMIKYYDDDGGEYEVHPDGSETPIMTPHHLIAVDEYGNAYFYNYDPNGYHQYYTVDGDGSMQYIDPHTIPGYDVPEDYQEHDYPRVVEWDEGEGWVLVESEDGYYARYYLNGDEDPTDQYGNVITNGGLPFAGDLLYVDEYGNAYFRGGEEGDYYYFHVAQDGGMDYIDYDEVPDYADDEVEDYVYPRVVEWDYDAGWVMVQDDEGQYARYYIDGAEYPVDADGNQLPPNGAALDVGDLLYVDPYGNAYFRIGEEGDYSYYTLDEQGHSVILEYEEIPGYGNENLEDGEYAYPRTVQWDAGEGWVVMELENGQYAKYYEDRPAHFVDEDGNEIYGAGSPGSEHLVQIDQYGNAYFQFAGTDDYEYWKVTHGGGAETIDPATIPDYDYQADEDPDQQVQVVQYDADAGWVVVEDQQGYLIKLYENGDVYFVDQYGNEISAEAYEYPTLVQVDAQGNAYVRSGEGPDYTYQVIYSDGGYEDIAYEDIPDYEPAEDDYDYPRVVEWDYDEGWVIVQDDEGQYAKYYADGTEYPVDEDGNQLPGAVPALDVGDLVYVDESGRAYFREGEPGDYSYYTLNEQGYSTEVEYEDIPEYGVPVAEDDYVVAADPEAGWVIMRMEDGGYAKFYEDRPPHLCDEDGNEIPGGVPPNAELLLQVDEYGNAYFRVPAEEGHNYMVFYADGGYAEVAYEDIPGYEEIVDWEYDYPRTTEWDAGDGWVIIQDEAGDYIKYYEDRPPHYVDAEGNEIPGTYPTEAMLVQVDEYGNAYFKIMGEDGYEFLKVDYDGGLENINYADIPDYDYEPYDADYDYPRTVAWDANAGWVTVETDLGYQVKLYEDGQAYFVDEYGNETPAGDYPMPVLLQVDEYGNAYLREGEGPDYNYLKLDQDGGYETITVDDIPGYEELDDAYDGDYDPAWAEHYDDNYDFDHPYVLYGEPDPPGENQAPNVYTFGGGRAMIVRNADGSETITWYSEGGYTDGYVEYKATVEYVDGAWVTEPDALPVNAMPQYGIYDVDGAGVYDPYHPDAPWGEPSEVIVLEDRVIALWETDEGQIRSEWYRGEDGAREVTYPDGLVLTWNGDAWNYEIPDDWTPPDYEVGENLYTEAAAYDLLPDDLPAEFGEGYPNPENHPDFEYSHTADMDGTPVHFFHSLDGTQTIVYGEPADGFVTMYWLEGHVDTLAGADVTDGFQAMANIAGGEYAMTYWDPETSEWVETPPLAEVYEQEIDGYLPEGAPEYFGDPMWVNPETDPRFVLFQSQETLDGDMARMYAADFDGDGSADYAIQVVEYADGRIEMQYRDVDGSPPYHTIEVTQSPDGQYYEYHVTTEGDETYGVPEYEAPDPNADAYAEQAAYDLLPDNLPDELPGGYANPEADPDYHFSHTVPMGGAGQSAYMFHNEAGTHSIAVVTDGSGNTLVYWFDGYVESPYAVGAEQLANAAMMSIDENGQYDINYWNPDAQDWSDYPPAEQIAIEADGYLPDGAPEYFGDPMWVNPELDERFELYDTNEYGGISSRVYRADLDGDGNHDYQIVVNERPDGTVEVQYYEDYQSPASAWINITQDANGYYQGYAWEYGQDTQGAAYGYATEGAEEADTGDYDAQYVYNLLHDDLPGRFYGNYVNPEYDQEYQYHHSETYGDAVYHVFDHGSSSIVVQENADGTQTLYWHDEPAGALTPPYADGAEARAYVYGNGQYNLEHWHDGQWVDELPQEGTLGDDYEVDGYFPDGAGAYFIDERWPNPEDDERFEMTNRAGTPEDGYASVYNADLTGDGVWDYQITVIEHPNGQVQVEYSGPDGLEARIHLDQYGTVSDYDYYGENPMGIAGYEGQETEIVFEADGYLPQGAPDYLDDDRWPNPETDERFEMTNQAGTADGGYARNYNADLDNDGVWDYQVTVIEHPNGLVQVEYYGANGLEARHSLNQDANGYYMGHDGEYYGENPQGVGVAEVQVAAMTADGAGEEAAEEVAEETEPAEVAETQETGQDMEAEQAGLVAPESVFYGLPAYFEYGGMTYPSPAQGDWQYEGVHNVGGVNMHQFSQGNYTVMVQDNVGGDRVIFVNDHATGSNVDAGYILRYDGTLEVHPDWAQVEPEPLAQEQAAELDEDAVAPETEAAEADQESNAADADTGPGGEASEGGAAESEGTSADDSAGEESEEDLQFLTDEEQQRAEEAGEEPLEFNGPETGDEPEASGQEQPQESAEEIEEVVIEQPDIVEGDQSADDTIAPPLEEDDLVGDDFDDDDDDGTGF